MAGRGGVVNNTWDGFVPRKCRSNRRIIRLNAELKWEEAREPLHRHVDVKNVCGIGPGMPFARSMIERLPWVETIGLVPCAIEGTKLSYWSRGTALYNQTVKRGRAATGPQSEINAILWFQGESDAFDSEDAESYRTRFEQFAKDVRHDLGNYRTNVIQVGLSPSGEGRFTDAVRKAKMEVNLAARGNPYAESNGLELRPDHVHLTAATQIHLGRLMAEAHLQVPDPNGSPD